MNQPPWSNSVLSDPLLDGFAALIYAQSGIRVSEHKRALLSNRLRRRLRATGEQDFSAYFQRLRSLPSHDPEWGHFLQEVSTHETYLFRDEAHWQWFGGVFAAEHSAAARRGRRTRQLRVWSAACSTGDEAYTIAACLAARLSDLDSWKLEILGTDLGAEAIAHAERGVFSARSMRMVPQVYRRRFFEENRREGTWTARPVLRRMTAFRRHNLMTPLGGSPFDVVFLKNVLIYFDSASKRVVLEHVAQMLTSGGYLVCGAAEGVFDLLSGFDRIQPWLYRKI
jgi:chemotaxis protein methyltransferase CheR